MNSPVNLSSQARSSALEPALEHYYRDVLGLPDWEWRSEWRLSRCFERYALAHLLRQVGSIEGRKILDVGCGWGGFLLEISCQNARSIGIEPDSERARIARDLGDSGRNMLCPAIVQAVGETLPFLSACFDIVCCYEVLEHTKSPKTTISEMVRVIKPGGTLHIMAPNYLAFYEMHYKVPWLPLLPKPVGRAYLNLLGRNPAFLRHIRCVTPLQFKHTLNGLGADVVNVSAENARERLSSFLNMLHITERIGGKVHQALFRILQPFVVAYVWLFQRHQEFIIQKAPDGSARIRLTALQSCQEEAACGTLPAKQPD